jgi:hypothetical protein
VSLTKAAYIASLALAFLMLAWAAPQGYSAASAAPEPAKRASGPSGTRGGLWVWHTGGGK